MQAVAAEIENQVSLLALGLLRRGMAANEWRQSGTIGTLPW